MRYIRHRRKMIDMPKSFLTLSGICHLLRTTEVDSIPEGFKRCECGYCDTLIPIFDGRNIPRRYKRGHNRTINLLTDTRLLNKRTTRKRAKLILTRLLKKTGCDAKSGFCNGQLEAHHIDKNPFNNNPENLLLLCGTHHTFADNRNLTLEELKSLKLKFYVSSDGRRRYQIAI